MAALVFLFLYHLLLLLLLLPNSATSKCPESFQCGHRFSLEFPFSQDPQCGMFTVTGCNNTHEFPTVRLGEYPLCQIIDKISTNKFKILDVHLSDNLKEGKCIPRLDLLQSPSISFAVASNLTPLYSCTNQTSDERIQNHFKNYSSFYDADCGPSTVYYLNQTVFPPPPEQRNIPADCGVFQLPVDYNRSNSNRLLELLTPEYTVEWKLSQACDDCFRGGGQCLENSRNEFHCSKGNSRKKIFIGSMPIAALTSILIMVLIFIWVKRAKAKQEHEKDLELFLNNNGNLVPKRYKHSSIKKMTNSYRENLGKGGYGSVYKGHLPDGHLVAVKVMNESNGNGEDFMNEVASISRTSHVNIVPLLGFCFEGSKRALIYELMPNGSLEKFIRNSSLGWDKLFEIAVGVARGLEYLHQGCNTRILHLDIKPQNILLDKDLNPRISDFGLAKLCPNRSSIVSMLVARGTVGYIAPEVFSRNFGEVSYKSDVYSYGMLVLEMVGGRKDIDPREVDRTSDVYFPHYIYGQLEMDGGDVVGTMNEDGNKRNLMIIGLWCIQTNPKDRPSMTKVVHMLEGKFGPLQIPPKPYIDSPPTTPARVSSSESL